ncbi:NupC/NupG family nucleoside CNT transporter [Alkalicoccobacillus gibsonii]|uniref:NupC/NupG family nucleoside CNT transporter n=1 Tax=Alkalicoccobacillus gibsonii TaxID=79881 RepID=UPI003513D1B4
MSILIGIIGLLAFLGFAFLISNDKKAINFKAIGIMVAVQLVLTVFMLNTSIGMLIVEKVAGAVSTLVGYGHEGVAFVTGGIMVENGASVFFLDVLMIVIFTSALLSILTYTGILPLAIKLVGGALSKLTGLPKVETFNAVNSMFFGQSEALIAIKGHLSKFNGNRLFVISTSAMASVSASIVGAYMTMLQPKYVLIAIVLNMFNGLIIASIIAPVRKEDIDEDAEVTTDELKKQSGTSFFDALTRGALDGGKVALIVASMLVAFIGIISMLNGIFDATVGHTLQELLGFVFAPLAFLMGVPMADVLQVGNLMGTKIMANEFVAMLDFVNVAGGLSVKGEAIISVFLMSFGAVSSIGIIAGTAQAISGATGAMVAKFGVKLLTSAVLVSLMSATIVGLFI